MTNVREFIETAAAFKAWCVDEALPTWASVGIDPLGGFYERLSEKGHADTLIQRRARVHFRQLYVFSHARHIGWISDNEDRVGAAAMHYARAHVLAADGSIPLLMGPDGYATDQTRDLYSHAFILLSLAWRYKTAGDGEALDIAERTLTFLDTNMASPHGGWIEQLPKTNTLRRQNPHMHFFEAFLALFEVTRHPKWLERAGQMFELFSQYFFHPESACLLEYFEEDWTPHPSSFERLEPGHMMEWVWLLAKYSDFAGVDVSLYTVPMFRAAERLGRDSKSGFLVDEVSLAGKLVRPSRRSWPQTEYIKAAVALTRRGEAELIGVVSVLTKQLLATYLSGPFKGGWHDSYDVDGLVSSGMVSASTFYHLLLAAIEVDDLAAALSDRDFTFNNLQVAT